MHSLLKICSTIYDSSPTIEFNCNLKRKKKRKNWWFILSAFRTANGYKEKAWCCGIFSMNFYYHSCLILQLSSAMGIGKWGGKWWFSSSLMTKSFAFKFFISHSNLVYICGITSIVNECRHNWLKNGKIQSFSNAQSWTQNEQMRKMRVYKKKRRISEKREGEETLA